MAKWEYLVREDLCERELNILGRDQWELVAANEFIDYYNYDTETEEN